jgi:hypothetical protein
MSEERQRRTYWTGKPFNNSSTSSSDIFSPSWVRTYLSSPAPMKPFPTLSNTWNPLMNSSVGQPFPNIHPLRSALLISHRHGYEIEGEKTYRQFQLVSNHPVGLGPLRKSRNRLLISSSSPFWPFMTIEIGIDVQVPPTCLSRSFTSACVGFWPNDLSSSPRDSLGTWPVPLLSNRANASLYSGLLVALTRHREVLCCCIWDSSPAFPADWSSAEVNNPVQAAYHVVYWLIVYLTELNGVCVELWLWARVVSETEWDASRG